VRKSSKRTRWRMLNQRRREGRWTSTGSLATLTKQSICDIFAERSERTSESIGRRVYHFLHCMLTRCQRLCKTRGGGQDCFARKKCGQCELLLAVRCRVRVEATLVQNPIDITTTTPILQSSNEFTPHQSSLGIRTEERSLLHAELTAAEAPVQTCRKVE
jgi:hypothetical protein